MKKYLLEIVVGVNGALIMVVEVVGSRILAPYAGGSTFVWTALIGIILAALSLGYWQGGKFADKSPKEVSKLSFILFISGTLVLTTAFLGSFILTFVSEVFADIRIISTLGSLVLFAPANFFMGMVTPVTTRLSLTSLKKSGEITGRLYAISTVGSIAGTFLTGFFLLAFLGVKNILILSSVVFFLLSLFVNFRNSKVRIFLTLFALAIFYLPTPMASGVVEDKDSSYSKILIKKGKYESRPVILLSTGRGNQSGMFEGSPDELVFPYTKYFRLVDYFMTSPKEVLMVGGGGYSFPKDFLRTHPQSKIDVVEIDPEVTKLAEKYFHLQKNPNLSVFHQDARLYIADQSKTYDAIFIDAYSGDVSIPFHLVTRELVESLHRSLSAEGVVIANVIGSVEGNSGRLVRALYTTYKSVFPQVFLFPVSERKPFTIQNIILVAVKSDDHFSFTTQDPELTGYLNNRWEKEVKTETILTDDFAPVEYLSLYFQRWD